MPVDLLIFSLVAMTIFCDSQSCLTHFNVCSTAVAHPVIDFGSITSETVPKFCDDMTLSIIPCLAGKVAQSVNFSDHLK